ncbi:MAG: 4Fe-4S dicluster domain-containing protein [Candidatus Woesearchaeota archaeon]
MKIQNNLVDIKINQIKCNICEKCVNICPQKIFKKTNNKIIINNINSCIGCLSCSKSCPTNAIKIENHKFKKFFIAKKCNNNCIMCFEHDVNINDEHTTKEILKEINTNIKGNEEMIILSGAEITLKKDLFKILYTIKKKNSTAQIFLPTNGRMFCYKNYIDKFNKLNLDNVKITISILGSKKETHDKITQVIGSFNESIKGIKNLLNFNYNVNLNITILKKNYKEILDICKIFLPIGIKTIQLAIVEPNGKAKLKFKEMIPQIKYLKPIIQKALKYGNGKVKTKNIPNCILGKYYNLKYFNTQNHLKKKISKCLKCKFYDDCDGYWKEYFQIYGNDEIKPIN